MYVLDIKPIKIDWWTLININPSKQDVVVYIRIMENKQTNQKRKKVNGKKSHRVNKSQDWKIPSLVIVGEGTITNKKKDYNNSLL